LTTPVEVSVWAEVLFIVTGLGLVVYAVTGGADLGVGLWHFFASGPRRDAQKRALRAAIAPIWEANHVWLIFVIVVLFSAFPHAFSALSIALHVPIGVALIGIVFRGSAYTFRAYGIQGDASRADWDRVFAWASVLTPICFGLVLGGIASGDIRVENRNVTSGYFVGWTTPFALSVGVFSLALFGMLSAVYLAADTKGELSDDFRKRALVMEVVSGVAAFVTFALAAFHAPLLYRNLSASSFAGPIQVVTAGLALTTMALLYGRKLVWARFTAAAQVATVVIGFGLAMDGHFILPDVSLARASAHPELLPALALALGLGSLLLVPALAYLYWVFKGKAR
jgi:cytochrome bd ubiquinol oxidase subunit II